MRNEILRLIQRSVRTLASGRCSTDLAQFVTLFPILTRRLCSDGSLAERLARWQFELDSAQRGHKDIFQVCEYIVREIDFILDPDAAAAPDLPARSHVGEPNSLVQYLLTAFTPGKSPSVLHPVSGGDLTEFLDDAVQQGLPLLVDPPWTSSDRSLSTSLSEKETLVVCSGEADDVSTADVFAIIKFRFEELQGPTRPRLWMLPSVRSQRVLVALGDDHVVKHMLNDITHRIIQLANSR